MFKCKQLLRRICVVSYVFLLCGGLVNASNLVSKTNTLIGTQGNGWASGYLYPGATYPFGMVQFTPTYFTKQLGFVINQLSGAGCDHMGNFPTLPIAGALRVSPDSILNMQTPVGKEIGTAGYYAATVDHSIRAELTVTERTGMARYTFSSKEKQGTVIIGGGVAATAIQVVARDMRRVVLSVESQLPIKFTLWLSSMRMRRVLVHGRRSDYMRIIRLRKAVTRGCILLFR